MRSVIVRSALLYSASSIVSVVLAGLATILAARFLEPAAFGAFQALRLVAQYATYANLGVPWAMHREVPDYISKGDTTRAQESINLTFSFVLMTSILVAIGLFLLNVVVGERDDQLMLSGLLAILIILQQIYTFMTMVLTSKSQFAIAIQVDLLTSLLSLLLVIPFVTLLRLPGLLLSQIIWYSLGIAFIVYRSGLRVHLYLHWERLWKQIQLGLQFTINGFLFLLSKSADRSLILIYLGSAALGYYGVVFLVTSYVERLGAVLGRSLFPRIVARYGAREQVEDIRVYLIQPIRALAYFMPVAVGPVCLSIPLLIQIVLPQYLPGIVAAQILLVGTIALTIRTSSTYFFVALAKLHKTFPIQIAQAGLGALLCLWFIWLGTGITGVALGTSLAHLATSAVFLAYALSHFKQAWRTQMAFLAETYWPTAYCVIVLLALESSLPTAAHLSLQQRIVLTLSKIVIFVVASLPIIVRGNRLTHVIDVLRDFVRSKVRNKKKGNRDHGSFGSVER